ncbi:MAG: HNH endonuclease [Deltaproteobacteria bacterium]|nr:HNH endonuclease [Deltaproteobacteria bacterium]
MGTLAVSRLGQPPDRSGAGALTGRRRAARGDPTTGHLGAAEWQICARGTLADGTTNHPGAAERQICARGTRADRAADHPRDERWGMTDRIHVTFVAPLSVSVLFRIVMQRFAAPTEPRWRAPERMLKHVLAQWRNQPRHRDPVFARDGRRCSASGCSSFSSPHDHHIIPRSAGGTNDLGNRTTA